MAVIKMIGSADPEALSPTPQVNARHASEVNIQEKTIDPLGEPRVRKSSAEVKATVAKPCASNRSVVALSMFGSSSTIATIVCRFGIHASLPSFAPKWNRRVPDRIYDRKPGKRDLSLWAGDLSPWEVSTQARWR